MKNWPDTETEETVAGAESSAASTGFERIRGRVADQLHHFAETLGKKTAESEGQNEQSGMAQYGQQASEWLDQSAEYIRNFDCEQADASFREYVRENPGRSLLIAGAAGLVVGAILQRR